MAKRTKATIKEEIPKGKKGAALVPENISLNPGSGEPPPGVSTDYGARGSKAKTCVHCKHDYLKPCATDKARDACPNWQHLKGRKK